MTWYAEKHRLDAPPALAGNSDAWEKALVEWLRKRKLLAVSSPIVKARSFRTLAKKEAEAFKREARAYFTNEVTKSLEKRQGRLDPIVAKRVDNFDNEESLVHWCVSVSLICFFFFFSRSFSLLTRLIGLGH